MSQTELQQRDKMNPDYQWDLTTFFASDEAHEAAFKEAAEEIKGLANYQGTLGESSNQLLKALENILAVARKVSNVYGYAHLKNDQDQSNDTYQTMEARSLQLYSQFGQTIAFFEPELMAIEPEKLEQYINDNEELSFYKQYIEDMVRGRDHVLTAEEEGLIAQASEIFGNPQKTFSLLTNADFSFPTTKNEEGQQVPLTDGSYIRFLESTDRSVRKEAFEKYYSVYKQYANTIASTLGGQMKVANFNAKVHKYDSARQAALANNNIPESVYDTLVEAINDNANLLHEYTAMRRDLLGVDQLEFYDIYTPLLGEAPLSFTYDESKEIVLKALAPLGEDYLEIIEKAFDERWIDVYENKGKRGGAYSSGTYDSKPYILMNWQNTLNTLYTLVHELGHSVHSYLSRQNQEYVYSGYSIFVAEIASTTNENLLTSYLLDTYSDKNIQLYIINHFLDSIKSTVYRQTQFAEFEHFMHVQDQEGQPLTAEFLTNAYRELNARYYGKAINSDSEIAYEWARIPHFYLGYYVYQYATGFAAATYFASKIYQRDQDVTDKYLTFLKSGSSDYPIETMKKAGLDMTQRDYIDATLELFKDRLAEFKSLI
ncbi:oligoendopeptidase F [Aerococcaceae bacterium DSM 111022]|nr:oligoendopeptidase F [Aerococcaceae bacterium DSM 111022]